jgi:hypothetical protein
MAEITAKQVKGGCSNAIREGKCYPFLESVNLAKKNSFNNFIQNTA